MSGKFGELKSMTIDNLGVEFLDLDKLVSNVLDKTEAKEESEVIMSETFGPSKTQLKSYD